MDIYTETAFLEINSDECSEHLNIYIYIYRHIYILINSTPENLRNNKNRAKGFLSKFLHCKVVHGGKNKRNSHH